MELTLAKKLAIAENAATPAEILKDLALLDNIQIRIAVVSNPNTPCDTLFQLGAEFPQELLNNPVFPLLVLENPNLGAKMPTATLVSLLKLANPEMFINWVMKRDYLDKELIDALLAVANNLETSKSILEKLYSIQDIHRDLTSQIVEAAAMHVNFAGEISTGWEEIFLKDIRTGSYLLRNSAKEGLLWELGIVPEHLLDVLLPIVQLSIAWNPDTPDDVVAKIQQNLQSHSFDFQPMRNYIKSHRALEIDASQVVLNEYNNQLDILFIKQMHTAKNPNTSTATLLELSSSRWLVIRKLIASHSQADKTVLEKLANDKPYELRLLVIKHPNVTPEILDKLAISKNIDVKLAIAQNTQTSLTTLEFLAKRRKGYHKVREAAIKTIAQKYPQQLGKVLVEFVDTPAHTSPKLFLLLHPIAPREFLSKYSNSPDWRERYAIAQNPSTPQDIRKQLANDANRVVRAVAKAILGC